MSCGTGGKKKAVYTGNQIGWFNFTGLFNFVAGGPTGSGLSAGTSITKFIPDSNNRRPWLRQDAKFDDKLLDACWPTIGLNWFIEIELEPTVIFRVSNTAFYVQDEQGINRYIDARVERPPTISVTVGEWLSPNYEVSDASFTINNRDGHYNDYLPLGVKYRQWSGAGIKVLVGFGEKRDNYFTLFDGQITIKQGLSTTRDSIDIKAYDKLDLDEIPMPPRVYSSDTFPDIIEDYAGKPIPLVYGDWTVSVADSGSVEAVCINALDDSTAAFLFKVSDTQLESIDEIYLQRGTRKEGQPGGAVKIDIAGVSVDLPNGQFIIPKGEDILDSEISYEQSSTAGMGSGLNLITGKDDSVDFIAAKIQEGDRIIRRKTGEVAYVSSILTTQLGLTGGVTFDQDDEYLILTRKYAFIKGDKVTVKCKGKPLNLQSVDRLTDISSEMKKPQSISVDKDASFWLSDDQTQKIYKISFEKKILKEIAYADVDSSITSVTSISIATDQKLWVIAGGQSKIYRYDHDSNTTGLIVDTTTTVGIMTNLDIRGVSIQSNNRFWIVDGTSGNFYEVDAFDAIQPFVTRTFNITAFDASATDILDISVDEQDDQLVIVDRNNNKCYRVARTGGTLSSSFLLTVLAPNVSFVTGVSDAQDGSLFFVDQGTLSVYNYNEQSDASSNPAFIARDILQKYAGHNFGDFDLNWNTTARQLYVVKCRVVFNKAQNLITFINGLLNQYNAVFHLRFGKFSIFWINFDNFTTTGKLVGEKDIKEGSFKPTKEMDQYFNSLSATYSYRPFSAISQTSDTYVSPAAVTFAGKEIKRILDMPTVYRREDLDRLLPLFVKLSAPEPEFVEVTFGFRTLRAQMQDFFTLNFDGDINCKTGKKESGRRYNHVPCMIRKMTYDLGPMTVDMKLWSLGNTAFGDYNPSGSTVGGEGDTVVLSNLGRIGRLSPIGTITGAGDTIKAVSLEDVNGVQAYARQNSLAGQSWEAAFKVDLVDGATKSIIQTLTISSSLAQQVSFIEDVSVTIIPTIKNAAGFIVGGHYLQYSTYPNLTNRQKQFYASLSKPTINYPTSRTQELEEQRSGAHNFDDGGIPYVLYPSSFVSY